MALANYADLQASVAQWLHRADLAAQIPDFIALAEDQLARDLRVAPLVVANNLTVGAGGDNTTLPNGCVEVLAVRETDSGREVRYVTPTAYNRARSALSGLAMPLNYTVIGGSLYVAPVWSAGGTLSVNFFRKETALSDANTSNWYLANAPDCLLYAALAKGASELRDAEHAQLWQERYTAAMQRVNAQYSVTGEGA